MRDHRHAGQHDGRLLAVLEALQRRWVQGPELGYAKDSVPVADFQVIDPQQYGTPTGYVGTSFVSYNYNTGAVVNTAFPSVGSVRWPRAGSRATPTTADRRGPACSGTPLTDVDNTATPSSGLNGASSVAYRLWCQHGPSLTAGESQITDWGQLTNLSSGQFPGQGTPIGVPIRIIGVNAGSGTAATFNAFAAVGHRLGELHQRVELQRERRLAGQPADEPGPRTGEPRDRARERRQPDRRLRQR